MADFVVFWMSPIMSNSRVEHFVKQKIDKRKYRKYFNILNKLMFPLRNPNRTSGY